MSYQHQPKSDVGIWLYYLSATLVAAFTAMVFLYSTFETKNDASDNKSDIEHRIEFLESKLP